MKPTKTKETEKETKTEERALSISLEYEQVVILAKQKNLMPEPVEGKTNKNQLATRTPGKQSSRRQENWKDSLYEALFFKVYGPVTKTSRKLVRNAEFQAPLQTY